MWETFEDRLQNAEYEILELKPGYEPMSDWNVWIKWEPALEWVWNTENINPKYIKKWLSVECTSSHICRCWCLEAWKEFRERAWAELFWTGSFLDRNINEIWRYQMEYEADLPSREDSLEQYRILLSSIPDEVFNWAKADWKEQSLVGHEWNIRINTQFKIKYSSIALPFRLAEARARYWRNKIGAQSFEEIELLPWETDADLARVSPSLYRQMMIDKEQSELADIEPPELADIDPSELADDDPPTMASMIEFLNKVMEQAEKDMAKSDKRPPTGSDEQVKMKDHTPEENKVELENTSPNKVIDQFFPSVIKAGGEEASDHPSASSEDISRTDYDLESELEEPKNYAELISKRQAILARGGNKKLKE